MPPQCTSGKTVMLVSVPQPQRLLSSPSLPPRRAPHDLKCTMATFLPPSHHCGVLYESRHPVGSMIAGRPAYHIITRVVASP